MKSTKQIKSLEEVLGKKIFRLPSEISTDTTPEGKRCMVLGINGVNHVILTGVEVELDQQEFSILKDSGIINSNTTYSVKKEFDPIRHYA